jgi:excisionase family DNA binding protein
MPRTSDLLTRRQAADFLGLSVRRVDQLREQGELPSFRRGRYNILIKRTDLALLKARRASLRVASRSAPKVA